MQTQPADDSRFCETPGYEVIGNHTEMETETGEVIVLLSVDPHWQRPSSWQSGGVHSPIKTPNLSCAAALITDLMSRQVSFITTEIGPLQTRSCRTFELLLRRHCGLDLG